MDNNENQRIFFESVPIEQKISILIKQIHLHTEKILNNSMAEYNITAAQTAILVHLKLNSDTEINPRDIEERFMLSKPTVSGLIKRLYIKGLVEIAEGSKDRRYKQIVLSPKGEEYLKTAKEELDNMNRLLYRDISDKELEDIYKNLGKMLCNLKNME